MIDWICSKSFVRDRWLRGSVPTNFVQDCTYNPMPHLLRQRDPHALHSPLDDVKVQPGQAGPLQQEKSLSRVAQ